MDVYEVVIERCPETGLYVGYIPGFPGAHSQGETLDELNNNLREADATVGVKLSGEKETALLLR